MRYRCQNDNNYNYLSAHFYLENEDNNLLPKSLVHIAY